MVAPLPAQVFAPQFHARRGSWPHNSNPRHVSAHRVSQASVLSLGILPVKSPASSSIRAPRHDSQAPVIRVPLPFAEQLFPQLLFGNEDQLFLFFR